MTIGPEGAAAADAANISSSVAQRFTTAP
jgi:hypothetical protein